MERRRRTYTDFAKFPQPDTEQDDVLRDVKEREYMSKFKEYHVRTVFYLSLLGMTEEQMAVVFDISAGAFSSWKLKHPTFLEALQKGKEQADAEVVYSLYQSAVGFEHPSEQIFCSKEKTYGKDAQGRSYLMKETPKIIRVPIVKKYPPSVKAAIKWLETRQPTVWSERPDVHQKLSLTQNTFNLTELTMEQLKLLQGIGEQQNTPEDRVFHTTTQKALKEIPIN